MSDKLHSVMRRSALTLVAAFLVLQRSTAQAESPAILVHKDPNCSCCSGWVKHLKDAGLAACHTAEVDGYVLEGHVPAVAVRRLLEQRPTAIGLSVPGMPAGSPGMEGGTPRPYDVVLFGKTGRQPFMHFVGSENVG